jgi:capsular exopolysaccharide synthesis family protein
MDIQNSSQASGNGEIDLIELFGKYMSKWKYFAVSIGLCLILAFIYLKITPPQYTVSGSILLRSDDKSKLSSQLSMLSDMGLSVGQQQADDEIEVVRSKRLIGQMVNLLNLQTQYFYKNGGGYKELYKSVPLMVIADSTLKASLKTPVEIVIRNQGDAYSFDAQSDDKGSFSTKLTTLRTIVKTPWGNISMIPASGIESGAKYKVIIAPFSSAVESLASAIDVSLAKKESNVIKLSIVTANTQKGKDIINTLIALYNRDVLNDKNQTASKTAEFVNDRLQKISVELSDVEQDVENYQKSHEIADIPSQTKLVLESSADYQKQMTGIEIQKSSVEWVEQQLKKSSSQYDIIPVNLGIEDKGLSDLIAKYDELLFERNRMQQSSNVHNPSFIQLENQIRSMRNNVLKSIDNAKQALAFAQSNLDKKDRTLSSKIKEVPTIERQFTEIKRQQEIKQNLYLFLLQKREENALSLAAAVTSTKIVDPAYVSLSPVAPKRNMILLIALFIGVLITVIYLYVYSLINNKIYNKKDVETLTKLPILGEIGTFKGDNRIVVKEGSNSALTEMFRMLRTNLNFMFALKQDKVVLVTSSISGEGKTFIAMNLAISLALLNKKVLVVGLDIRLPRLADYMHVRTAHGVTSYLTDESADLKKLIVASQIHPSLDVLQSGPVPPNPTELLLSPRLDEMFKLLQEMYDYIIVDTAPIGLVSDTFSLNRIANAVIFVCRQDFTPKQHLNQINLLHQEDKLTNIGIVLNGVDFKKSYGYRYKGYGYGGYGKSHNEE